VFRRGEAAPRYQISEHQRAPLLLREAIDLERERPWTPDETSDFLRTNRKLRAQLSPQWTARLDEILEQATPHISLQAETRPHWDIARKILKPEVEPEAEIWQRESACQHRDHQRAERPDDHDSCD